MISHVANDSLCLCNILHSKSFYLTFFNIVFNIVHKLLFKSRNSLKLIFVIQYFLFQKRHCIMSSYHQLDINIIHNVPYIFTYILINIILRRYTNKNLRNTFFFNIFIYDNYISFAPMHI